MKKVNLQEIPESERKSPSGKFHAFYREVSVALGREPQSTDLAKRHPFDWMVARIPPGASLCPYHVHSAQWEFYVVIAGRGIIRDDQGRTEVGPGDAFVFPPGQAHQILNEGSEDFVYHVVADNPVGEICYYPDSRKWSVSEPGGRRIIKGEETSYFDGEDPA